MSEQALPSSDRRRVVFGLLVLGTVLMIAGTDLVLPAVPLLPSALGGTTALAQMVLAAYVVGTSVGLFAFGELGARFERRSLLVWSSATFAALSLVAALAPSMPALVAARFCQGAAGAAAAVFTPGMILPLYGERDAVKAIGRFGSIESLTPAIAPIVGAWLLALGGWRLSFVALAIASAIAALSTARFRDCLPRGRSSPSGSGGYGRLLADPVFVRYALSHALSLGALIVFVFAAPVLFSQVLGGGTADFVLLQMLGVGMFIFGANITGALVGRWGPERMIAFGTGLLTIGTLAIASYAMADGRSITVVIALFLLVNLGFGLRGPPGYHRAVVAARSDDARGAALIVLGILLTSAIGTAVAAPLLQYGLVPVTLISASIAVAACILLAILPRLPARDAGLGGR